MVDSFDMVSRGNPRGLARHRRRRSFSDIDAQEDRVRLRLPEDTDNDWPNGELPFVIGVVSDLAGQAERRIPVAERTFTDVSPRSMSVLFRNVAPVLRLEVENRIKERELLIDLIGDMGKPDCFDLHIELESFADFSGDRLLDYFPPLACCEQLRIWITRLRDRVDQSGLAGGVADANELFNALKAVATASIEEQKVLKKISNEISSMASQREDLVVPACQLLILELDEAIKCQIEVVTTSSEFEQLRSAWAGIHYLSDKLADLERTTLRVLDISLEELLSDARLADRPEDMRLHYLVVEAEFGHYGGQPFGIIALNIPIGQSSEEFRFMQRISQVAENALSPIVAPLAPAFLLGEAKPGEPVVDATLFGAENTDIASAFENSPFRNIWMETVESAGARFLALTVQRVLYRVIAHQALRFHLYPNTTCWIQSPVVLAFLAARAFERFGWPVAITGEEGGTVPGIEQSPFDLADPNPVYPISVESVLTETQEQDLCSNGIIPLVCRALDGRVSVWNAPTLATAAPSSQGAEGEVSLPVLLAASRIGHYLKALLRERVGQPHSRQDMHVMLNSWLGRHVLGQRDPAIELMRERPLRHGRVEISGEGDASGHLEISMDIAPHYQVSGLIRNVNLAFRVRS